MIANLTQQEYLTYFDAIQEVAKISHYGISNVTIEEEKVFVSLPKYSWIHARLAEISRLISSILSKKKRQERQQATDQKLKLVAQSIQVINKANTRLRKIVRENDKVEAITSPNYYTLRAAALFKNYFQIFQKWNQCSEEPKKRTWARLKFALRKFNGYLIPSQKDLKITNQANGELSKISPSSLYQSSTQPFIKVCRSVLRYTKKLDSFRLQLMGGFTHKAGSEASEIRKKEKSSLDANEDKAFEHVNLTAADPMALEAYWEAMRATVRPGVHQQLELSDEGRILHFKTQVGESLEVFFKETRDPAFPNTTSLFQLFHSAKHHFCHSESSKKQAIHSLISNCLKPYSQQIVEEAYSEVPLDLWLEESIKLFPEKENWIKALFFEEVIYTIYRSDHTRKEQLEEFSQNLICDLLPETYVTEKLAKRPKAS
ncbi:hypothetical protein [Parachlamydia sp. AcF125]|uniref:hypothetical protein n=1 Tax=Parachlamydia sp. AcF125 TaxID=2795736 RepID=UPI001BCA2BB3|nr:hypothetical protein [Parachlamydia sp. AcF125]MBS4167930.1 hypothetical protein [Parachlamydia sp. AcF125]